MIAKGCLGWILSPMILFFLFLIFFYKNSLVLLVLIPLLFITIFFLIFFRDPKRIIRKGIVSPADGRIRDLKMEKDQIANSWVHGAVGLHYKTVEEYYNKVYGK